MGNLNNEIEDYLYHERKVQRIQERREREKAFWTQEAKDLSERELLEEIFVMLKTKIII